MITINNLIAGYKDNIVLNNLNWEILNGNIHGLIGLNGSGKTTLMKCICKLHKFSSGTILINKQIILRSGISFLETEPYFYHGITGREYLSLFKSGNNSFDVDSWSELMHLPVDVLIDNYSTGMKKKLSLLMIIKLNRKIILLDEPFNGLDLESSRVLSTILKQLIKPDKIVIVTSHIIDTLSDICSDIHFLSGGIINKTFSGESTAEIEKSVFHEFDKKLEDRIAELLQ